MKDFPVFTTEYGVASLILREIPYQGIAYVFIRDSLDPEKLLEECVSFCRMCGAETILAKGHDYLEKYPLYAILWEMRCEVSSLTQSDASLFPVQEKTLEEYRRIYNRKIGKVPCGAWMTEKDGKEMLEKGSGYFIHRNGSLLGIGMVDGNEIPWVASVQPGAGRDIVCALAGLSTDSTVTLTVASGNEKAIRLYEALGFVKTREISRVYCIMNKNQ